MKRMINCRPCHPYLCLRATSNPKSWTFSSLFWTCVRSNRYFLEQELKKLPNREANIVKAQKRGLIQFRDLCLHLHCQEVIKVLLILQFVFCEILIKFWLSLYVAAENLFQTCITVCGFCRTRRLFRFHQGAFSTFTTCDAVANCIICWRNLHVPSRQGHDIDAIDCI